jgi:hypothetical protein
MSELDPPREQEQPPLPARPVQAIAKDRVADVAKVDAHLVSAPRVREKKEESPILLAVEHSELRLG